MMKSVPGVRIVLANAGSLAAYPEGGGHWSCFLQYVLGLHALGHDVFWLEVLESSGNEAQDRHRIESFLTQFKSYGLAGQCALLLYDQAARERSLEDAHTYGMSRREVKNVAGRADVLWNFASGVRGPLLEIFKRRVLIDGDPGHLQVSALTWDIGIEEHDVFLSTGTKLGEPGCKVPTLGVNWKPFLQFVYLPMWNPSTDPGENAPFTSVTQWTWEELWLDDRVLSISKRDAYLKYAEIPRQTQRAFELAANIHSQDETGDRELLLNHGWRLADPHQVADTPASYREYIKRSRAEFQCPKPIHNALRTGWFSDRSACYLATGRPVLAGNTGFGEKLPTGRGLLSFENMEEAIAKVEEIDRNYQQHMRAARELAEEYLSSTKVLPAMLAACGL
jgi:hypothetical protein